jgi:hypothetical protein
MQEYSCAFILLVGSGLVFIVLGLGIRLGYWRWWYLGPDDPIFYPKPGVYGFITLGLTCVVLSLVFVFPYPNPLSRIMFWGSFFLCILSILLVGLQPWWIKPAWVRWLEEENADILDRLIEEARRTKDWHKRVATQEGLEAWVAEVREKWGEPRVKLLPRPGRPYIPPEARGRWIVTITVIVVSSMLGQFFLDNGLIGFIGGWVVLLVIYLLRPKEKPPK